MLFHIDPLRLWVHKVLPVVYDDSLSYYEVLAKVTKKLNEVIDLTEEQNQYIEEFSTNLTNAINNWEDGMEREWSSYKSGLNNEWGAFQRNTEQYIENWKNMAESDIEDAIAAGINQFVSYFSGLTQTAVDAAEEAMRAAETAAQDAVDAVMPTLTNQFDDRYALKTAVGSPLVATTAAGMTDTTKVYVYAGSETGYVNGDWYYYDGTAWQDGGVYNSAAVVTDTTLSEAGVPADAKATGDEIADLKSANKINNELLNASNNLVNYGYDIDADLAAENVSTPTGVGIKRQGDMIVLNTVTTNAGTRIKLNGEVVRTGYSGNAANAVVDAWEGLTLQQYHKYRIRWVALSGTINDPSKFFVSVYTQGTHSTIGNSVRVSETELYRDFVYNTTPVNIVLAIASGAEFTNYKGMLILEDSTETFADYANPINAGLESGKNVIDYHYMSKYAILPNASAATAEVIGIEQIKETIRLNGRNNQGGYIWIRLNDGPQRTKTAATVNGWPGMAFENGHKYRIVSTMISGTVTYPSDFDWVAISVSVYKTGTHSSIASANVLDNGQYVAEFEYDGVQVSLALVVPNGTVFADAVFTITLTDITEFPNSGYNYLSTSPFVGTKKLAYNVSKLWSTSQTGMQGIAVYNGVLFQALNNDNYTDVMQTYNLSTGAKISEFSADIGHGNTINFGKSKYDPSDDYPLLYCACYDSTLEKRVIKVLRVTSSSATLVKTYMLPDETEIGYHAQGSIDEENGIFVLSTYKQYNHWQTYNAGDKIIITTTKQIDSAEYDSESGCYLLEKEKSFELPWYGYLQEGKVYGGYYWLLFSKPSTDDTIVYIIDYLDGGLHTTMTNWVSGVLTNEAEGIDFIEDTDGEAHMIIAVAQNGVYKVNFSQ